MKVLVDDTEIHATRIDYEVNRDIEVDMVADEYEIELFGGIPVPIPLGPRKPQPRVTAVEIEGTLEGKAEVPEPMAIGDGIPDSHHMTIKADGHDIEICEVYFQPSTQTLDGWEVDFIGLPCSD